MNMGSLSLLQSTSTGIVLSCSWCLATHCKLCYCVLLWWLSSEHHSFGNVDETRSEKINHFAKICPDIVKGRDVVQVKKTKKNPLNWNLHAFGYL